MQLDRVADIFAPTEGKPKTIPPYDVKYEHHTYRTTKGQHAKLKQLAKDNGIGLGDMMRWMIDRFIEACELGTLVLPIKEYTTTQRRLGE